MQGFFFGRFFALELALALASAAFRLYNHDRYGNELNKRPIGFILLSAGLFGFSTPAEAFSAGYASSPRA
jgi:hypothetical protein